MGPFDNSSLFEPLVSVIVPVYNRAPLVGRAVASVLAQTYQNFEIIVVDDASTDGLAAVLALYRDPRLRCVAHEHNRGAAAARNTGIAAANGEFLAFLDSDDLWFPDKLAHQVAAMHNQPPEVAGHVCGYDLVREGYRPRHVLPDWNSKTFGRTQLFGCTCGPGTTLFCRRSIFTEIGSYDEALRRLEDWDWLLRLALKGYRLLCSRAVLARVEVGAGVARRDVDAALQLIRQRHHEAVTRYGVGSRRIFEASLHLESAAAAFENHAHASAIVEVLHSLLWYPLRGGSFYWRMMLRAAGSLLGREQRAALSRAAPQHEVGSVG